MTKSKASKAYRRAAAAVCWLVPAASRAFKTKLDADLFLYQEEVKVHLREINHEHWAADADSGLPVSLLQELSCNLNAAGAL